MNSAMMITNLEQLELMYSSIFIQLVIPYWCKVYPLLVMAGFVQVSGTSLLVELDIAGLSSFIFPLVADYRVCKKVYLKHASFTSTLFAMSFRNRFFTYQHAIKHPDTNGILSLYFIVQKS